MQAPLSFAYTKNLVFFTALFFFDTDLSKVLCLQFSKKIKIDTLKFKKDIIYGSRRERKFEI